MDTLDRTECSAPLGLGPRHVLEGEQPGVLLLRLFALGQIAGDFGEPDVPAAGVDSAVITTLAQNREPSFRRRQFSLPRIPRPVPSHA